MKRMSELDSPGMQIQRGSLSVQGLGVPQATLRQIHWVATDGKSEMPQVDPDLVGSTGERASFEQGGGVRIPAQHAKLSSGW